MDFTSLFSHCYSVNSNSDNSNCQLTQTKFHFPWPWIAFQADLPGHYILHCYRFVKNSQQLLKITAYFIFFDMLQYMQGCCSDSFQTKRCKISQLIQNSQVIKITLKLFLLMFPYTPWCRLHFVPAFPLFFGPLYLKPKYGNMGIKLICTKMKFCKWLQRKYFMVSNGKKYTFMVYTLSHFHSSQWFFLVVCSYISRVWCINLTRQTSRKDEHE